MSTLHGSAEVVPNIAISVGVGIVLGDHVDIEGITITYNSSTPSVSIRTENKVFFIVSGRTICYFIGDGKIPVVPVVNSGTAVSYTHLRAHETRHDLVCRLLL